MKAGGIRRRPRLNEVVPSTLMKQGDFSKYVEPDGRAATLYRPERSIHRRQLWHDDPLGSLSQIALNTLKQFYPDPNIGDPTAYTDNGVANYQANVDAQRPLEPVRCARRPVLRRQPEVPAVGQVHLEELPDQQPRN